MRIAVEGCAHGELEKIYDTIEALEKAGNFKVDLLICCGDFEATRNLDDLNSMAVPLKYRTMGSFHMYYSGEKIAPILTLFIGGNHECSNYLQELPYGGWVAPNIYYLGYSGVINIAGIRIAGLSGIYKSKDFHRGRFEAPPYTESTKRSVYHVRNVEVFRMKQINSPIDIFLSHDWPLGIHKFGNEEQLINDKPFFEKDMNDCQLGSPPNQEVLLKLKPKYWFAAHLHVKFAALVPHEDEEGSVVSVTKFLALDKCLPKRKFLQILDEIPHDTSKKIEIEYDLEWLAILHYTNHLISTEASNNFLPGPGDDERWKFTPTEAEKNFIYRKMGQDLRIPLNFSQTVPCYNQNYSSTPKRMDLLQRIVNPQTEEFCQKLGIDDPLALLLQQTKGSGNRIMLPYPITPDGADNSSSFIDSEISGFCSGSDENDKSVDQEESDMDSLTSPNMKPRLGMVLPPPKFETEISPKFESSSLSDSSPSTLEADNLFYIDDGTKRSIEETPSKPKSQHLGVKKFKRRNHNLYQNNEDE